MPEDARTADAASAAIPLSECLDVIDNTAASPVIIHAPHGGTRIPASARAAFRVTDDELERELGAMTDHATGLLARSLASGAGVSAAVNALSRLVVDVERFPDVSEEMNAVGMGVLYTHGSRRQPIRTIAPADRSRLMEYFDQYSAALARLVERALAEHGRALIIDLHSFSTRSLPYELHADERRPELCVGFEPFHLSDRLRTTVFDAFVGWDVTSNEPFHGAYVPLDRYGTDARVQSVMLEVRRDRYMDEATGAVEIADLERLEARIAELIRLAGA